MKRSVLLTAVLLAILTACAPSPLPAEPGAVRTVRAEATPAPETVMFWPVPTPTPESAPILPTAELKPYVAYEWSSAEIDALASVYWAECNTDAEKLAVTQLILNRASYGPPFKSGIVGAVHQKGEFNRGRISDRNRENARANLDRCMNGLCSVPASAVYMSRSGRTLVFYDIGWNEVWRS